jgi:hypothetical protein
MSEGTTEATTEETTKPAAEKPLATALRAEMERAGALIPKRLEQNRPAATIKKDLDYAKIALERNDDAMLEFARQQLTRHVG